MYMYIQIPSASNHTIPKSPFSYSKPLLTYRDRIVFPFTISARTSFTFRGRLNKYARFKFNNSHFNGMDWDQRTDNAQSTGSSRTEENWAQDVGTMQGNEDHLMLENIDYSHTNLVGETKAWGRWVQVASD